ncbi:hypothetical protein GZ212_12135 [Mangrovimonas sp. CR14]|uniref:hypothetical protein n=1 Tax=Mangrovimonas sp. CR14 TaxID=2706120 RepID=UPI00141F95AC|nr:hypothetical protein [Mangrovimonas sp. CR14]NIK92904.1 hypothetical protein [Mangrovimonas sp. CR14]
MNLFTYIKKGLLCFTLLSVSLLYSQNPNQKKDSIITTDTIKVKKDNLIEFVEEKKDDNKFNKLLYKYLVRNPETQKDKETVKMMLDHQSSIKSMEGKYIRKIHIISQDPFGHSIRDTTVQPQKFLEKAGNALHVKTKEFVLKNYMLQKEGDAIDSLKIVESERLMRSQRFIRRVRIDLQPIETSLDSVDVYIYSLDSWSLIPSGSYSNSKVEVRLRERNFMGWGHEFDNRYEQNFDNNRNTFQTRYRIYNIQRSFVSFNLEYYINEYDHYDKSISLERNFFSPLARWAGGVYIGQKTYQDSIPNDLEIPSQRFKYNLQDYWGAVAFDLFKNLTPFDPRLNKFIVSSRYYYNQYLDSPGPELDPLNYYSDEKFWLMGVGFSQRSFVQDRFIKNYDIIEDVPIGASYGITTGVQNKNNRNRMYLGGRIAAGNYFSFGYLGTDLQYGGFLSNGKSEQTALAIKAHYYTKLMSWSDWKFRHFIWSDLILGNNRLDAYGDKIGLDGNTPVGIEGFYSLEVRGTKKWLTNIQIQSYSPYSFLGFRLSPFLNASFGLINGDDRKLFNGKGFAKVGLGILFTNDYLIFSNFHLSLAWYNQIPGTGNNRFKMNSIDNQEFQYIDYEFGKPKLVDYN